MIESGPILVMGAGGRIGGALLTRLEAAGARVRAAYHDAGAARRARAAGRDAVALELSDAATLAPALDGVGAVFLLTAETPDQPEHERALVAAADAASVSRVVKLSVWRADEGRSPVARLHRPGEQALQASDLAWTFLRPNTYMQNFLSDADAIGAGVLAQPASDAPVAFIDSRDIARVAASVLIGDGHAGRAYTLTGPEALTYGDVAATFARVLGHPVEYRSLSADEARANLRAAGAPDWRIEMLAEVGAVYRDGGREETTSTVEAPTAEPPGSLERFVQDHRAAFG